MGPWSFPIVAEARMAERLLEAERARLARTAAAGHRSRRGGNEPRPQASPSSRRRLLARASALALVACLVLGGAVMRRGRELPCLGRWSPDVPQRDEPGARQRRVALPVQRLLRGPAQRPSGQWGTGLDPATAGPRRTGS